jgi:hypothetical protein
MWKALLEIWIVLTAKTQISHQLTSISKLKSTLKGRRFESIEAIKANSLTELRGS